MIVLFSRYLYCTKEGEGCLAPTFYYPVKLLVILCLLATGDGDALGGDSLAVGLLYVL